MGPTGSEALRFQRHRDAQALAGETYYLFRSSQAWWADAGDSYVTGGNARGVVTSRVARVVVGYPLTRVTNGPGRIRVEPPFEIVEPRQQGELTAVATAGAAFEGWDGDPLGSTNTTTLTIGGTKVVQAWFSRVPLRLEISRQPGKVLLGWTPPAVLQSSDALVPADWQDLSGAASPYDVEPANAQRFYRLRRPRRGRFVVRALGRPNAHHRL